MRIRAAAAGLLGVFLAGAAGAQEADTRSVDIGGYGSFRFDHSSAREPASSFTLRRFVVTTNALLGSRFQVYSEIELERLSEIELERGVEREDGGVAFEQELEGGSGSELSLEQAWGQFNVAQGVGIRFGAVLPPVGRFNLRHDDNLWNLPRRPLIDRGAGVLPASAAWTEMGAGVHAERYLGSSAQVQVDGYVLNGVELGVSMEDVVHTRTPERTKLELEAVVSPQSGAFDGTSAANAVAGRVQVSPRLGSEIAISGYRGGYTPGWIEQDATISTWSIDGRQQLAGFALEGEWIHTSFAGVDDVAASFARSVYTHSAETEEDESESLETEAEVELSGLADERAGFWLSVERPIALGPVLGFAQPTLIPVVRYERAWTEGEVTELDFAGGVVTELERGARTHERWMGGIAFRPIPQAVIHLAVQRDRAVERGFFDADLDRDAFTTFTAGLAVGF